MNIQTNGIVWMIIVSMLSVMAFDACGDPVSSQTEPTRTETSVESMQEPVQEALREALQEPVKEAIQAREAKEEPAPERNGGEQREPPYEPSKQEPVFPDASFEPGPPETKMDTQSAPEGPQESPPEPAECANGSQRPCYTGAPATRGVGACKAGQEVCQGGKWSSCQGEVLPAQTDACDGTDTDCNGTIDAGCVTTLAGSGKAGFRNASGTTAQFNGPWAMAIDANDNLYVSDRYNHIIRKVTPAGQVTTFAGSRVQGFLDGGLQSSRFNNPFGLTFATAGVLLVVDYSNNRLRKVESTGVSTINQGVLGYVNGPISQARFRNFRDVAVKSNGTIVLTDTGNHCIRQIIGNTVSTLAGSNLAGDTDGTGGNARFRDPWSITIDSKGTIYVSERDTHRIRRISGNTVSTFAGGMSGFVDGTGRSAQFNRPSGLATDTQGNLYVADLNNHTIRKITPQGVVTTYAGTGQKGARNGPASQATFNLPYALAVDSKGNIYVAEQAGHTIRKIKAP